MEKEFEDKKVLLKSKLKELIDFIEKIDGNNLERSKKFDFNSLYVFFEDAWNTKEELANEITDKLKEFGYSTKEDPEDSNQLNVICKHGNVCQTIYLTDDGTEEYSWSFDVGDYESSMPKCDICMVSQDLKEDMIGRLTNYKFSQALKYVKALKEPESVNCLNILSDMWGNTGWDVGGTWVGDLIEFLVDFIISNEGWDEEYYNNS